MGQYYKGRKIGTCESMYYMRLVEAQALAAMGAKDDDGIPFKEYLADNVTRFRFPFPDEDDGLQTDNPRYDFERGYLVPAGDVEINHSTITVANQFKGGGNNVNILLACPYSQEFKDARIKTSTGGAGPQMLEVLYEGIRDGEVKTVFACARCGAQQRFSSDDVEKIKTATKEYYSHYDCTGKSEEYERLHGPQSRYDTALKIIERIH